MASEYESSILAQLSEVGVFYLEFHADRCIFCAEDDPCAGTTMHTLTREQMYKLSDEIRIIADGMEFLTCDGSENE